jgi:hypothetical protein
MMAVITGANVHNSQLVIQMKQLTETKIPFCYSLMTVRMIQKSSTNISGAVGTYQ